MTFQKASWCLVLVAALGAAPPPQKDDQSEKHLQAALHKEMVDGDLKSAIELYKNIVARYGDNRAVVAKALLQMGQCYEKSGQAEARRIYERIVNSYSDQQELAARARVRLASLKEPSTSAPTLAVRRVWAGPGVDTGAPSLDGRYLSYVDWTTSDLAIRDLATGQNRRLTNKQGGYPYFSKISPDSQQVAYSWCCTTDGRFELRLLPMNGSPDGAKPRVLYSNENVYYLHPRDWSPDGKHVLVTLANVSQTVLISVADGAVRVLKSKGGSFSPDGRYIVYDAPAKEGSADRDIFVLASDGSRETPLVEHPGNDFVLGWAPDGKNILFASDRTGTTGAWAIGVADGRPQGEPQLVKADVGDISPLGFTGKGAFYYAFQSGLQDVYIATLDPATGKILASPSPATRRFVGRNSSPAWSPDGQYLAYLSRRDARDFENGPRVISILSVQTGQERELSPSLSFYTRIRLRWSPDGRSLLASATGNMGGPGLYRIDVQSGEVALLAHGPRFAQGVWSTDGKAILYVHGWPQNEDYGIRVRDLETGREKEIYRPATRSQLKQLTLSPDGRWLALVSSGGAQEAATPLLVIPAAGGEPREVFKASRPEAVEWTADGTHLLFASGSELWRIPAEGGQPQRLGLKTVFANATLSVHPDGRRIAFTGGEQKHEIWVMENFLPPVRASR